MRLEPFDDMDGKLARFYESLGFRINDELLSKGIKIKKRPVV